MENNFDNVPDSTDVSTATEQDAPNTLYADPNGAAYTQQQDARIRTISSRIRAISNRKAIRIRTISSSIRITTAIIQGTIQDMLRSTVWRRIMLRSLWESGY